MMEEGIDRTKATGVLVEEVKSGNWGVGRKALRLEDVRAMQKS